MPTGDSDTTTKGEMCSAGDTIRAGTVRDEIALSWLVEASYRVFWSARSRDLRDLLSSEISYLWLQGKAIRGALFLSLRHDPVADLILAGMRRFADRTVFFEHLLPYAEGRLARTGARWLSVSDGPEWLLRELEAQGYSFRAQVVHYRKTGLDICAHGNKDVTIARVNIADVPALARLDATAFEPFWRLRESTLREAAHDSPYFLLARLQGRLVGYIMADHWCDGAFIGRLAVAPLYRGRGIGTRLMTEGLALMRRDNVSSVSLNTQMDNERSRKLYESLGFELTGKEYKLWAKCIASGGCGG